MPKYARVEQNPDVTNTNLPVFYFVTQESGGFYLNLKIPLVATLNVPIDPKDLSHINENFRDLLITEDLTSINNLYLGGPISTRFTKLVNDNTASGATIRFIAEGGGKIPGTGEIDLVRKKVSAGKKASAKKKVRK